MGDSSLVVVQSHNDADFGWINLQLSSDVELQLTDGSIKLNLGKLRIIGEVKNPGDEFSIVVLSWVGGSDGGRWGKGVLKKVDDDGTFGSIQQLLKEFIEWGWDSSGDFTVNIWAEATKSVASGEDSLLVVDFLAIWEINISDAGKVGDDTLARSGWGVLEASAVLVGTSNNSCGIFGTGSAVGVGTAWEGCLGGFTSNVSGVLDVGVTRGSAV